MRSVVMVVAVWLCASVFLFAQGKVTVDQSPNLSSVTYQNGSDAPWDLQYSCDLQVLTTALGNAGSEFDGTYGYSTRWASNLLHKFIVTSCTLIEQFSIPGVSGLRDLAYDGAFMYGGAAANTIYQMDFNTKTLIGTIPSPVAVRHIAYDEAADAFWVGNWNTPLTLVSRTGQTLATINTGLTSQYGTAYDAPPGQGPYIYVFDQGLGAGSPQLIHQFNITTGTATGLTYNVAQNFPAASGIAGGLWASEGLVVGKKSIGGVLQGTPDYYFAYELRDTAPPTAPNTVSNLTAYSDYTTPTSIALNWTNPTTYVNGNPLPPGTMIDISVSGGPAIPSQPLGTTSYTHTGLNDGTLYTYTFVVNDQQGNLSNPVSVSWHAGGHPVPSPPTNLQATGSPFNATLTWDDPTTQKDGTPLDDLDHINIYRNGVLVGNAAPGVETYTDTPPTSGFYYYTVRAVDNENPPNVSDPSNEAGAFVGATPDFLVWVHPDVPPGTASAASGDSLFAALIANGQSAYLTNNLFEFGTDLSIYNGVFVVLGIFANNGILAANSPEALALEAYVTGGGGLYLEGGDCFYYDPLFVGGHNINPWFDCVPLADGSGDLFGVIGLNEMSAFSFAYNGENNWMDELSSGGLSSPIWKNSANPDISGLYYNGWGGAAIGVVPSFGGFVSAPSSMVNAQKRTYEGPANLQPQAGAPKARPQQTASEKRFIKKGGYKPELAARIDRSKPLYKITPNGIQFLANTQVDLMAAYLALMNPLPEIIYYKFNEAGQTTTQNYAASGSPAPATATVLGLTMGGVGQEGSALIGNAGSSSTNYVNTGWNTNLSGSWSISFWVNDMPSTTTLHYFWGDNTASSFRCFTGGVAGADNLLVRATGMTDLLITGVAPGPSEVVVIYDAAVGQLRGYLNGVLQNTVNQTTPLVLSGTAPFKVGGYSSLTGLPLNTLMDEFKIYSRAIDVEPNSRDYAVTRFVDLPQFWYVGFNYNVKAMVVNEGSDNQTNVPVRFFVNGTQVGSDVLVSLVSGDSMEVSFPWTPAAAGLTNIKIQSFLPGDQDPANDFVTTDVNVGAGAPVMIVSPSALTDTLAPPATSQKTFNIANAGSGPLDFTITIEGVSAANAKVDFLAGEEVRSAPIIARGREIPVEEYLQRAGAAQQTLSLNTQHPEDLLEPYDQITPSRPGNGLEKISSISLDGPDVEEVFGGMQFSFGPLGTRGRGNHFFCTTNTTLTEHRLFLNFATSTNMEFLVYEGTSQSGTYNLINVSVISSSGTGQGWYSSGPINVPLVAGRYYLIYPQWNAPANYYNNQNIVPYPIPASFGELQMGVGWNWAPTYNAIPPATQTVPTTAFGAAVAYYQTIVTGAGTSWLSVDPEQGTVPAGGNLNVQVTFDATGLLGGDYYADIIVEGNDPANLADTVSAHLFVVGDVIIRTNPTSVVFPDPVFVNGSDQTGLWVVNDGNGLMTVSDITSSSPNFSVNMTNFEVPPFDSVEVTVTFAPTAVGTVTGSLTIFSNASNNPTLNVPLQGTGILGPEISVDPQSIDKTLNLGAQTDVPVTISNIAPVGAANLDWSAEIFLSRTSVRINPVFGPVSSDAAEARHPRSAEGPSYSLVTEDLFDLQFSFNLQVVTGALGNAGAEFDGTYYYSTRWASNLLHKINMNGALVEEFSIPGVTGLRDLAYDGAFMYGGAAANTIYQMDFTTKTLIGTIPSPVPVRHIAYDEGADAFWVGNWDTPPTLVSRTGQTLATLTSGLTSQYGSAYDNYTPGGPYLWIFNQGNGSGFPQLIHQFNLNTGTATGFAYDVTTDFPTTAGIAGGLWIGEGIVPGTASIGGVLQGTPDMYFVYELAATGPVWMELIGASSGSIAPGDVGGFIIRLFGVQIGLFQGSVVISSNDQTDPVVTVPVTLDVITGLGEEGEVPSTFDISRNYPNPFNPSTTLDFQLPQVAQVKLEIYNVLGQKVRTLVDAQMQPGRYKATWDGRNDLGVPVTSGVYIYRFVAGDFKRVQKMVLMK